MSVRHFFNPKRSLIFARPLVSIQNTCGDIQSMRQSPWYSILPKTIWHGPNMLMDTWTGPRFKDHLAWTKCLMAILESTECLPAISCLTLLAWSRSQTGQISSFITSRSWARCVCIYLGEETSFLCRSPSILREGEKKTQVPVCPQFLSFSSRLLPL